MTKFILDMAISIDGYISGPGDADVGLYDWYFDPVGSNRDVVDELVAETGAIIMGRNVFGAGPDATGYDDTPYEVPHFVVTHQPPDRELGGPVEFRFVTDGIESALRQAREVAGDKWVTLAGGADVARQYLDAGLIDEILLHVVPKILAAGKRLFAGADVEAASPMTEWETIRVVDSPGVTHLRWRALHAG